MNSLIRISVLWVCLGTLSNVVAFQGGKREPAVPANPSPTTRPPRHRIPVRPSASGKSKNAEDAPKTANLTIKVTPVDSIVRLNDQPMSNLSSDGSLSLTNLKPGPYVLMVGRSGYRDVLRHIEVSPNSNDRIEITLELIKGTLSVKPNVDGGAIVLRSIDRDLSVGEHEGAIDQLEYPPGDYEVTISKPGYKSVSRRFTLKPGATLELEPRLDPLPAPTPTPTIAIAPRSHVSTEGKYLVIHVVGASGDPARTLGTIGVTANRGTPAAYIDGELNGLPCRITFMAGENVAEGSLIDSPNPSNGWAVFSVRVRPKDPKRPITFAINWSALQTSAGASEDQIKADILTKAVPAHQVIPKVPSLARSTKTYGLVKVSVQVDADGNVKSATAFDGPMMLRQAAEDAAREWRFKPATRNGVPIPSTETIYFTFEGY